MADRMFIIVMTMRVPDGRSEVRVLPGAFWLRDAAFEFAESHAHEWGKLVSKGDSDLFIIERRAERVEVMQRDIGTSFYMFRKSVRSYAISEMEVFGTLIDRMAALAPPDPLPSAWERFKAMFK